MDAAGPSLELQPLSILTLRFGFEVMQIFGSFGNMRNVATDELSTSAQTIVLYSAAGSGAFSMKAGKTLR